MSQTRDNNSLDRTKRGARRSLEILLCASCLLASITTNAVLAQTAPEKAPAEILAGRVPVLDFLRFIQFSTGLFVNYPVASMDGHAPPEPTISVAEDFSGVTYEVVKAILEANDYLLKRVVLQDGTETIQVEPPKTARDLAQKPGARPLPKPSEQVSTLILAIEQGEIEALKKLLRGLASIESKSKTWGAEDVVISSVDQTLVIKAPNSLIEKMKTLINLTQPQPKRTVRIISVPEGSEEQLVDTVCDILNIEPGTHRPVGRGQHPVDVQQTRIIPDSRTHKVIVDTADEKLLGVILRLIEELTKNDAQ